MLRCFVILFLFTRVDVSFSQKTKKCGNEACDEVLFQGTVTRDENYSHPSFIQYKIGEIIKVYAIELNDRPDLWEGEIDENRRGLFYKNHIDHEEYEKFLENAVTQNSDLFVLDRDKKINALIQKEKSAQALARVWLTFKESKNKIANKAKPEEPPETKPTVAPTAAPETGEPLVPRKSLSSVLKHEHHSHEHGHGHSHENGHGHSHEHANHQQENDVPQATTPPPVVADTKPVPAAVSPTVAPIQVPKAAPSPPVVNQQTTPPPIAVASLTPVPTEIPDVPETTAEPHVVTTPTTPTPKAAHSTISSRIQEVKTSSTPTVVVPQNTTSTPVVVAATTPVPVSVPVHPKITPTPEVVIPATPIPVAIPTIAPLNKLPKAATLPSPLLVPSPDDIQNVDNKVDHEQPMAEEMASSFEEFENETEHSDEKAEAVDDLPPPIEGTKPVETSTASGEDAKFNEEIERMIQADLLKATKVSPIEKIAETLPLVKGTEIKNELGDEYCIKEDCVNNVKKQNIPPVNSVVAEPVRNGLPPLNSLSQPPADHVVHGKNPVQSSKESHKPIDQIGHAHRDHDHSHDHGHAHEHGHVHNEGHGHSHIHEDEQEGHGHGHSHEPPGFREKLDETVKTGKSYAVWLKQNLKPFVVAVRFILKPLHRVVPVDFREIVSEREILIFLILVGALIFRCVDYFLDSDRRRRKMIQLCQFAELSEKYKVLEVENDKLKKFSGDAEKILADSAKERENRDAKLSEMNKLQMENISIKEANAFLEEEIEKLKKRLIELGDQEKAAKEFQRKIDEIRQRNEAVEKESNELRSSFEREREKVENAESRLTTEHEATKKAHQEIKKLKHEVEEATARTDEMSRHAASLERELSECRKEMDGLKSLLANCDVKSGASSEAVETASNNGKDWDWVESDGDDEAARKQQKRNSLMESKMAEIVNAAKLQSELNRRQTEMEEMRKILKETMRDKEEHEQRCGVLTAEKEVLQKSLNELNEKTTTLQSKINVLRDFYEDQRKELTKQLTQQQISVHKQTTDLTSAEEETNKLREENGMLRKTYDDVRAEVKNLDSLLSKTRNELDRCRHESWTRVRQLERERDSLKSDNLMLRSRLMEDDKRSPSGSAGGHHAGDVSNNSSEAELMGISTASAPPSLLPMMPNHPPPPSSFYSGHTSPFYPPPQMPVPPFGAGPYAYPPPPRDEYEYGYYSPNDSLNNDDEFREFRRSLRRRPKSKARSSGNLSRSPSPSKDKDHRRARSRGATNRESFRTISPPPVPKSTSQRQKSEKYSGHY